jgi:nucleoside-diphosphate-sugar epimerase
MRHLVTGAAGFLGSHLVDELLRRGAVVRAFVRSPEQASALTARGVEAVVGDIRDPQALAAALAGVQVVYHCAAAVGAHFSREEIYHHNRDGVENLLQAARDAGPARVVLVSSINVLGTRNFSMANEDLPCRRSHDPAADVKIDAERLAEEFHHRGVAVTTLRPGFVYGPRDERNLPQLIRALQRGRFAFIGSRDNVVPIVHVRDVVQALLLAGENPAAAGRIYNLTDGSRTTIGEFVDLLADLLNLPHPRRVMRYAIPYAACVFFDVAGKIRRRSRPAPITRASLRFLGTSRLVDIGRARTELGYTPSVLYRQGLPETVRWLNEHREEMNLVAAPVRPIV